MTEFKMNKRQLNRQKWVDDYNNSLPQQKHYMEEFDEEISVAIGGIYDSEYMAYVFSNVDIYDRIKRIKRQLKKKHDTSVTMVSGIMCTKCNVVLEPHLMSEHLDKNHRVHCCENGHKRQ